MSDYPAPTLPRPPESAPPYRFPLVATIAPVVVSVALWLITKSVFALVFAALGPVTAVAGLVDSRRGARRTRRRERARFDSEAAATREAIRGCHGLEIAAREEHTPDARVIAGRRGADPARWTAVASAPLLVAIGRGLVASAVRLDRPPRAAQPDDQIESVLDDLVAQAATLREAPVSVDATLGIGVVGPTHLTTPYARGLAVQLAWALPPADHWRSTPAQGDPESEWLCALPQRAGPTVRPSHYAEFGAVGSAAPLAVIAVASAASELPGSCRIVIALGGDAAVAVVQHPDRAARQRVTATFVSREEATAWALDAAQDATRHGLTEPHAALPHAVELASLAGPVDSSRRASLAAPVARSAHGDVVLDLVQHGPHAVVGGTTGSGKSELLIAWVVAMASSYSPERVCFLLVDFKGGSAFGSLAVLVHTVGTITDLDETGAARALASLRAELAHRERALAQAGARTIDELAAESVLPRLVIVVDEFAAMLAEHPDLHALFADIAARGRSLGVHLILCTQRPAGVVRDGVLANADLRISLRVNNGADSIAVVGTDGAADIAAENRGRAVVRFAGGEPTLVQVALATDSDVREAAARWAGSAAPRRPWREPLPAILREGPAGSFGALDLPHEQRWAPATWTAADGHVLVLGAPGSGKTNSLRAFGGSSALWVPTAADAAWDVIEQLESRPGERVVVIDDLDSLLSHFGAEHRAVVVERLTRVLRDGGGRGIRVAVAAQRLTPELQSLASLMPSRLWLRHASRQEFVLAGGDGARHDDRLPPGGGLWRGDRVQVLWREPSPLPVIRASEARLEAGRALAIVTTRVTWLAERLAATATVAELATIAGEPRDLLTPGAVLLGDPDEWQSRWGVLASLRGTADILFHGCSLADYRALTRSRELPPPLSSDPALCWRLEADGGVARVRLPP